MVRFEVRDGSQSRHCRFEATVVDMTKPVRIGGKRYNGKTALQYEPVCERFDRRTLSASCLRITEWRVTPEAA